MRRRSSAAGNIDSTLSLEEAGMTTATITPDMTFVPTEDVHYQNLADEAVLLNIRSGVYFGLDTVGTRIWNLLVQGNPLSAIVNALEQEFDVTRETLVRDVPEFVDILTAKELVRIDAPEG
jgi:hypothetical protein